MAIKLVASADQYIDFGDMASLKGLTNKSVIIWTTPTSQAPFRNLFDINTIPASYGGTRSGGYNMLIASGKARFVVAWSGGLGGWDSPASISNGVLTQIGFTYDDSSSANNPLIYLNGVSVAVTEIAAPSGTLIDYDTVSPNTRIGMGTIGNDDSRYDGNIYTIYVYPRILTPAEIANNYTSLNAWKPANPVFAPNLSAAAGVTVFNGAVLAAGNTIRDNISGVDGVPSGSPVGIIDNSLRNFTGGCEE